MKSTGSIVLPKQPFFVLATHQYYKVLVMKYGISHFYSFEVEPGTETTAVAIPDGCVDILFCCDADQPYANICGTVLHPHKVFHKACHYFGVRFMPGVIPKICDTTMPELLEREVPLQEVLLEPEIYTRIVSTTDFEEQQNIFMALYLKYYLAQEEYGAKDTLNRYLLEEITRTAGSVTVAELAEQTGYSERYVNKVFKESFGVVPKLYSKLMRFQYLLDCLDPHGDVEDFAVLSLDTGFYDQSHMIKNFKDYTYITPRKYVSMMQKEKFNNRLIIMEA